MEMQLEDRIQQDGYTVNRGMGVCGCNTKELG